MCPAGWGRWQDSGGQSAGRQAASLSGKHQLGLAQSIALWRQAVQSLCRGPAVCHLLSRVRRLRGGGSGDCTRPRCRLEGWGEGRGQPLCLEKEASALGCPAPPVPSSHPQPGRLLCRLPPCPAPSPAPRLQPCPTLSSDPHLILCFLLFNCLLTSSDHSNHLGT